MDTGRIWSPKAARVLFFIWLSLLCAGCGKTGDVFTGEDDMYAPTYIPETTRTEHYSAEETPVEGAASFDNNNAVHVGNEERAVYRVKSESELMSLSVLDTCTDIVIDGDLVLANEIVFKRPVDITVKASSLKSSGGRIVLSFAEEAKITVNAPLGVNIQQGAIVADCPMADLSWIGISAPSEDYVRRYMNVASYNGRDFSGDIIGGAGKSRIVGICFETEGGAELAGVDFSQNGNVITAEYSFSIKDDEIKTAVLKINAEKCAGWTLLDDDGTEPEDLSARKSYILRLKDDEGNSRGFFFIIKRRAERLPVISIYTESNAEIESKEVYTRAFMSVDCSGAERFEDYSSGEIPLWIKGRGNASWSMTEKKSYRLKLDEKASVLGITPDKDWVLVSNYFDKSLIRNAVAHRMAAQMEYLYYTPTHIMVDLFINGEYRGVYSICDKIEVSKRKINIDTSGDIEEPAFSLKWDGTMVRTMCTAGTILIRPLLYVFLLKSRSFAKSIISRCFI